MQLLNDPSNITFNFCYPNGSGMTNSYLWRGQSLIEINAPRTEPYNYQRVNLYNDPRAWGYDLKFKAGEIIKFDPNIYINTTVNYSRGFVGFYMDLNRDQIYDSSELIYVKDFNPFANCNISQVCLEVHTMYVFQIK